MSYEIKKVLEDGINIKIGSYASKSNAIKNCLPGYSVFDKATGEMVYTNEAPVVEKHKLKKEDYKKMWFDLDAILTARLHDDDYEKFHDAYKTVINMMKDLTGENLSNK